MEYVSNNSKQKINNKAYPMINGVKLTSGRLKQAFDNNLEFLKSFETDRMMYWFRVNKGKAAPGAPYAFADGHFENNLFGQTAGMFLMAAGSALLWQEDARLRATVNEIVDELYDFIYEDGCLLPVDKEARFTLEYPNYVRAWLTFGLLAAGYSGNKRAFELARRFGDWFNNSPELPSVKDMNLGFQGILVNTELYMSPVGVGEDLEVAQRFYRENWYLEHMKNKNSDALYRHPSHPHGTILTAVEGYLDIYRATGEEYLLECVKNVLGMIESDWQHIGGGIVMCEQANDPHYPGCNYLSPIHSYNELCCTTFWILLNQRMALLEPENAHYYDQIEDSVYNMLVADQVGDKGYHYNGYLETTKDVRYLDKATCCAATGARLTSMLPQLLYTYNEDSVYVNLYSSSALSLEGTQIELETDMPYSGEVKITVKKFDRKFLRLRIPYWAEGPITVNGVAARPGEYLTLKDIKADTVIAFKLPFGIETRLYSGWDIIPDKKRYAFKKGPLLLAALRSKNPKVICDIENIVFHEKANGRLILENNNQIEFMPYMDVADEPFTVYPILK